MSLKRAELAWRRYWIRNLVRRMRVSVGGAPDWRARSYRVLFLRHDRAGDMILSTGVMRAIARSHPTITLDVLASPANASLLDGADYVRKVITFDKRRPGSYPATTFRLRRERYDAVIDCMVTAPSLTTLLLILASGARHRIGIAGRGNDEAFTITVPAESRPDAHMVHLLGALARAFGGEAMRSDMRPVLTLSAAEREAGEAVWRPVAPAPAGGARILINVSAGTSARLWPDENYVAVIRHLRRRDPRARFRLIAAPNDMTRAEHIAREGEATLVRTPRLRDAVALVATADFVFTPDTSIAHAAAAFNRPCVAMYVAGSVERWGLYPPSDIFRSVEHSEPTLATLSIKRMIEAVDAVWNAGAISRRG